MAVLVIVQRVGMRRVLYAVGMALGIVFALKQLPSAACHLVGSWCDARTDHLDIVAGQHNLRCLDVFHGGHAALERDVDVHHVTFAHRCGVAVGVALLVVVLIDDGDNLLRREVEDVALTAHEQRRYLCGRNAVDGEVLLVVRQTVIACVTFCC